MPSPDSEQPREPPGDGAAKAPRRGGLARVILPAVVMLVVLGGLTLLLVGGSGKAQLPGGATSSHSASYDGAELSPASLAPALSTLHNDQGQSINLASYRGKAVFLTFLYTHCPDVCPIIAGSLHTAFSELGACARDVQLIAVSVDPRGDTPQSVARFLQEHQLTGEMQYLIGSAADLAAVWKAWNVGSARDVGSPQLVNHSALVYGISAKGMVRTIYSASFKPQEVVHDVPALLAS
jgi:protein SCO1